jgi:hypothetical protein
MHVFRHTCFVIFVTSLSLSAIANPCVGGGIGGTGVKLNQGIDGPDFTIEPGGIGGTGITITRENINDASTPPQSGIGGTGILGVMTDFNSMCTGGFEMHYWTSPASADIFSLPDTQSDDLIESSH